MGFEKSRSSAVRRLLVTDDRLKQGGNEESPARPLASGIAEVYIARIAK